MQRRGSGADARRLDYWRGDTLLIDPVVAASEGANPDLWRRWLAIVLDGIASGPRTKAFPGHAPDVNHVEEIIAKPSRRPSHP